MYKKLIFSHLAVLAILFIDQYSKSWALSSAPQGSCGLFGMLHIIPVWNRGLSFGLFCKLSYANNLFLVCATVACTYFYQILRSINSYKGLIGCSMILGGALGNVVDRVVHSAVLDFIDIGVNKVHLPLFNLADAFITLGSMFLLAQFFSSLKRGK